jgi:hypothetical protein
VCEARIDFVEALAVGKALVEVLLDPRVCFLAGFADTESGAENGVGPH